MGLFWHSLVTCYSPFPLISMLIASQTLCQAGLELWNKRPWQEPFHMEEGIVVAEGKGFSKAGYELIWPFCCVGFTKHARGGRVCSLLCQLSLLLPALCYPFVYFCLYRSFFRFSLVILILEAGPHQWSLIAHRFNTVLSLKKHPPGKQTAVSEKAP